jgi:phospholipase/carboxylesterase
MSDGDITHRFVPARSGGRPALLLLHRTGGSESDLLEFGDRISRGGALLAPRGQVLEDGKPRYFRRISDGLFDLDDLKLRTQELGDFVTRARQRYGIGAPVAVGFSNGANIAWSLLLASPGLLAGAVLMRPMMPFEPRTSPLGNLPVLVISGRTDTIVPPESAAALPTLLRAAGARVEHDFVEAGHTLTAEDGALATAWLDRLAAG